MSSEEDPKQIAKDERKRPEVERLLRQFLTDGTKGNSPEFQRGWCRNFGRATGEHSGRPSDGFLGLCDDEHCWCGRPE